jgi:hypothetical protein
MSQTTSKVVTIYPNNGEPPRSYKRFSARIPDFLAKYPPEEGYKLTSQFTDFLSLQKGRLTLVQECVSAGRKPEEVGLPPLDDINVMVCTVTLVDPGGDVLINKSASMDIRGHKDLEVLETAATQRVFAGLGFGGDIFDDDEDVDLKKQGLLSVATKPESATSTIPEPRPVVSEFSARKRSPDATPEPETAPLTAIPSTADIRDVPAQSVPRASDDTEKRVEPAVRAKPSSQSTRKPGKQHGKPIPPTMLRNIHNLADARNVKVPDFANTTEAMQFLRELKMMSTANSANVD